MHLLQPARRTAAVSLSLTLCRSALEGNTSKMMHMSSTLSSCHDPGAYRACTLSNSASGLHFWLCTPVHALAYVRNWRPASPSRLAAYCAKMACTSCQHRQLIASIVIWSLWDGVGVSLSTATGILTAAAIAIARSRNDAACMACYRWLRGGGKVDPQRGKSGKHVARLAVCCTLVE